jgi:hypothetical protein
MSTVDLMEMLKEHHASQLNKLDAHHEEQKTQIEELRESVKDIDNALRGSYEKKGLLTRVHQLESSEETRKRFTMAAVTSAIGSAVAAGWAVLTKH